jgi:hypothetical protein
MKLYKVILILWFLVSMIVGLFIVLKRQREDQAYSNIFNWFISPLFMLKGVFFTSLHNKKYYFKNLFDKLLLK